MCDVFWRSTKAPHIPWESSKYAIVVVCTIALFRQVRQARNAVLPLAYMGLLVPSVVITLNAVGSKVTRDAVSFNLMGPWALGLAAVYFAQLKCTLAELRSVLVAMLGPAVALAAKALFGIATSTGATLAFGNESNPATSGGFGPNQVSLTLSAGLLAALLLFLREKDVFLRVLEFVIAGWLLAQCMLTFSRGGLFSFVLAAVGVVGFELTSRRNRWQTMFMMLLAAVVVANLYSHLEQYTGGTIGTRFHQTTTTERSDVASGDWKVFQHNLVFGAGVGRAAHARKALGGSGKVPHTEFTRLVAEHGSLGLLAIVMIGATALTALARAPSTWSRGVTASCSIWTLASMLHADMRIAAVSLVFGLGQLRVVDD
jgi:hypothetical protein